MSFSIVRENITLRESLSNVTEEGIFIEVGHLGRSGLGRVFQSKNLLGLSIGHEIRVYN